MTTMTKSLGSGPSSLIGARHVDLPHARLVAPLRPRFDLPRSTIDEAMKDDAKVEARWWTVNRQSQTSSHHVDEHQG
jgi:hypothetical protein